MRIGRVIGKLSLVKVHPTLVGKRWVLARPLGLTHLAGQDPGDVEELTIIDELGAREDDLIGFAEGGEAANPYLPKPMPVDAYNCCILDSVEIGE